LSAYRDADGFSESPWRDLMTESGHPVHVTAMPNDDAGTHLVGKTLERVLLLGEEFSVSRYQYFPRSRLLDRLTVTGSTSE
jgi:hypothetical protein